MNDTKKPSAPTTVTAWLKTQSEPTYPSPEDEAAADRSAWEAGRTPHPLSTLTERRFAEHLASIRENRHPGTRAATLAEVERALAAMLVGRERSPGLNDALKLVQSMQSDRPAEPRRCRRCEAEGAEAEWPGLCATCR